MWSEDEARTFFRLSALKKRAIVTRHICFVFVGRIRLCAKKKTIMNIKIKEQFCMMNSLSSTEGLSSIALSGRRKVCLKHPVESCCCVCLHEMKNRRVMNLPCGHTVHLACFVKMKKYHDNHTPYTSLTCPMCRGVVVAGVHPPEMAIIHVHELALHRQGEEHAEDRAATLFLTTNGIENANNGRSRSIFLRFFFGHISLHEALQRINTSNANLEV